MRPTVYGKQVVFDNKGKLCGVNLGYNFYCEHEEGTNDLVQRINTNHYNIINNLYNKGYSNLRASMIYKKALKKEQKVISRWDNTPFKGYVLSPDAEMLIKKVTIRTSEDILNKYTTFMLKDGVTYDALIVSNHLVIDSWEKKLGKRRIFGENELLYMSDYNGARQLDNAMVAGAWASDGFMVISDPNRNYGGRTFNIIEELVSAIKRGLLGSSSRGAKTF